MENDEEFEGIFLFKDSKVKVSNLIFKDEEKLKEDANVKNENNDKGGKWMKKFLKRFLRPSLLFSPITPITSDQIISESSKIPRYIHQGDSILHLNSCALKKKITRGNRRHKIKTRKQRNYKAKEKALKWVCKDFSYIKIFLNVQNLFLYPIIKLH